MVGVEERVVQLIGLCLGGHIVGKHLQPCHVGLGIQCEGDGGIEFAKVRGKLLVALLYVVEQGVDTLERVLAIVFRL